MQNLTVNYGRGSSAYNRRSIEQFPDPFMDVASTAMPNTIYDALWWCEYLMMANGPYRAALSRVLSYFITDVEIVSPNGTDKIGREEKQKYLDFLNDTLGIRKVLQTIGMDYLTYGNSFTSLLIPFSRYLSCKNCGTEQPLRQVVNNSASQFSWTNYQFHAKCAVCDCSGEMRHIDRRGTDTDQMKIKRWDPHQMEILWDPFTDDTAYIWRIPGEYKNLVARGHLHQLERANWEVIEAVRKGQSLRFDDDVIYHMKEDALAGVRSRGWGISRVLVNFRQAWCYQVMQRYNEAIALDHIVPFRVLTPMPRPGQNGEVNDPVLSINMGSFTSRVNSMLRQHRRDPASWNVLPFPIEYQALGGDATQLAPHELMNFQLDTLLCSADIPVEMYKGSMSLQAAGPAMRLYEANWAHLVHALNRFLNKLVDKVSTIRGWEPVNARLARVKHADDLNRQMAALQLMMGGQISRTTGLATVGMDYAEEERRKLEEERIQAEATQDMQEEMEQEATMQDMAAPPQPAQGAPAPGGAPAAGGAPAPGGQPAAGGAPAPGGAPMAPAMGPMGQPAGPYGAVQAWMAGQPILPNMPTTMEEVQSVASTLAQQALAMPESQKDSFLVQLRKENATMATLVTSQLEQIRREARRQGGDMVMQQQFGKQGGVAVAAPPTPRVRSRFIDLDD